MNPLKAGSTSNLPDSCMGLPANVVLILKKYNIYGKRKEWRKDGLLLEKFILQAQI